MTGGGEEKFMTSIKFLNPMNTQKQFEKFIKLQFSADFPIQVQACQARSPNSSSDPALWTQWYWCILWKAWPKSEPWKRSYLGSWSKRRESQSLWSYQPGEALDKPRPFVIRCHERTVKEISPHLPCHWWYLGADKIRAAVKGKSEPLSAHTWAAKVPCRDSSQRVWGHGRGRLLLCSAAGDIVLQPQGAQPMPLWLDLLWGICVCSLNVHLPVKAGLKRCFLPRLLWKFHYSFFWENLQNTFTRLLTTALPSLQCSFMGSSFTSHWTNQSLSFGVLSLCISWSWISWGYVAAFILWRYF